MVEQSLNGKNASGLNPSWGLSVSVGGSTHNPKTSMSG